MKNNTAGPTPKDQPTNHAAEDELDPLSPESVQRIKSMTKDDVGYLSKRELRDVEEHAAEQWEAMDESEKAKLRTAISECCLEYTSAVDGAITNAGQTLFEEMHDLRAQYGTLIVDAAIDDTDTDTNLDLAHESFQSIADAEGECSYNSGGIFAEAPAPELEPKPSAVVAKAKSKSDRVM